MHGELNASIFSTTRGHPRSPGVTEGQISKIFHICQMTYQMKVNLTGNLMQSFVAPPKVNRGHRRLKIENIQHISNDLPTKLKNYIYRYKTKIKIKNWTTEGRSLNIGRPKDVPLKMDDRMSAPNNWKTEGRPIKIGRPKVGPQKPSSNF